MKAKERLDRILTSCRDRMQEEVSALLGKDLSLGDPQTKLASKSEFFEVPAGKSVFARIQLEGDLTGKGALMIGIQDAIRIGGTLIMLPESELQAVISDSDYTEELQDSYGEVANIFCGSLTSTFEEQYPKSFRLVRTEQEVILPAKVDPDSEEPIPGGSYFCASFSLMLGSESMGEMHLLLPAVPFGLAESAGTDDAGSGDESEQSLAEATGGAKNRPEEENAEILNNGEQESEPERTVVQTTPPVSKKESEKQKRIVDAILSSCCEKIGEEVGALVGSTMKLKSVELNLFSKEELIEQAGGKQVLTRMDVRGGDGSEAFLFTGLPGAIHLGGSLIMLPDNELEETVRNSEFGEDAQDAFGEITNIIAGVFTSTFEEQHRKKLGFVKTTMETVVPIKLDPEGDDGFPNQYYYLCSGQVDFDGKDLGRLQAFFPVSLFGLEGLVGGEDQSPEVDQAPSGETMEDAVEGSSVAEVSSVEATGGTTSGDAATVSTGGGTAEAADILIVGDDESNCASIAQYLRSQGYLPLILPFKSSVNEKITPRIRMVFLVMKEISEQGFGVAIKISTAGYNVPLVAAGPAWTRTLVIKAVKYGAVDILITPASEQDVREKVEMNLASIAA